jgi:RNA polymerase sigma factor (sigma-70 family)
MAISSRILRLPAVGDLRSDRQLVRAAQQGETEAASELIERYYQKVFSFVNYLGANGSAEDVTQEVFARALSALPRFNGTYRVGPWLMRIAKNLWIDESRRSGNRAEPLGPAELAEAEPPGGDNVWESVSTRLVRSVVTEALRGVPTRQRAALIMREIEGMSYADIAQVLGTNLRGAEATLRRARARFRMEVARSEGVEAERAVCRRVVRLLASGDRTADARRHLKACSECRARAASIGAADKLLAALPPLSLGGFDWKAELLSAFHPRPPRPRTFFEVLRGQGHLGLASPIAQVGELAASVAMATAVSVASVAGTARVTAAVGAPDFGSDAAVVAGQSPAGFVERNSSAPVLGRDQSGAATPSGAAAEPLNPLEDVPGDSTLAVTPQLDDALTAAERSAQATLDESKKEIEGVVVGTLDGTTDPLPTGPLPDLDPQQTGIVPGGIAAPRRRRDPFVR